MSKARAIVGLDCDASAKTGIQLLLQTRFGEMRELQPAALDWSDIEGVHDMRVASRRLRSALRDFASHLNPRKLQRANDEIKQIADALGSVRDNDVAIAVLEKLTSEAPDEMKACIELFAAKRRARREADRRTLVEAIADDGLGSLQAQFEIALEAALVSSRKGRKKGADIQAVVSFRLAGRHTLEARMKELLDSSTSLYQPFKSRPLHRMRIAAKRLRYATELFAQCWKKQLDPFAKDVAKMQGSLGELHDCDVWIGEFGSLLKKKNPGRLTPNGKDARRSACVWLLSYFTKKRNQHYRDALARWQDWEANDFFVRLEACLNDSSSDKRQVAPRKPMRKSTKRVPTRMAEPRT